MKRMKFTIPTTISMLLCVIFLHLVSINCVMAQSASGIKMADITGVITDATSGEAIAGATVIVEGTTRGAATSFDGSYTIAAAEGEILQISYIGYDDKSVTLGASTHVNVALTESAHALDVVVVTALGITRSEKALSYNVQQIDADEVVKVKDANLVNSLNGKVAGVNINTSSSGVGGAAKVVMRGTKSIQQSSNALYVIDGVPMYNFGGSGGTEFDSAGSTESVADINPEDVESVSVLTGAAAAALYGSNASNGAIIITTKKGAEGKTVVSFSSNTEVLSPFVMPEFQNRYGTGDNTSSSTVKYLSWGDKLSSSQNMGYDPASDFFQTGYVATENVSLSTGNERNQTYVSAGAVNSEGIVENNKYSRYNFTFRNSSSLLDDRLKVDLGASYIMQRDLNMVNQGIYSNPLTSAYLFPRGDDWEDIKMFERYDSERKIMTQYWPSGSGTLTLQNPYWISYRNLRENVRDRYMFNAGVSYEICDWISLSGRIKTDNESSENTQQYYATTNSTILEGSSNGLYGITTTESKQTYGDLLLTIDKRLSSDLSLNANIGASISDVREDALTVRGPISDSGLPNVFNVFQLDDTTTKREQSGWVEQTQSVFASVELGYKYTYYLTITGRNDWPSQLAGPNSTSSSFFYPSVGGSVVLSELFDTGKDLSFLKLRGSFASVGLPFPRFLAQPTYEWDSTNKVWVTTTNYPIYDLKPETTNSWEVGLTARFLDHFDLDVSYYNARTFNQTFDPQISVSSGYSTMYIQTGSVVNKGLELSLGYKNRWNDFSLSSNYVFSSNKNEILELVDNYVHPETGEVISKDRLVISSLAQTQFILKEGGTLGDIYSLVDFVRDDNGDIYVGRNTSTGLDEIYLTDSEEDIYLGSVLPKANMSWRNDMTYKNFGLGFMISARLGGVVYSYTQAMMDYYGVSEVTAAARDAGGVAINDGDVISARSYYSTVSAEGGLPQCYTYSATNVRLSEAYISYKIPAELLGGSDLTLSLVGRNLFMFYCKAPFDPEAVATTGNYYQGIDMFMMPSTRNIGFNVKLKF